ncbi:HNH endonuclease family protein [Streptomyces sp. NPDC005438]|uniref:HNH endonuclease family protein n=1 Tax=Streptomyces sp. NPDC005438 TaxID=3156880 RepID=UPI0033B81037
MQGIQKSHGRGRRYARGSAVVAALSAGVLLVAGTGTTAQAAPPSPPSASEATTMLGELTEQAEGSSDGYDRDKFPHWSDQGDNCNTREAVLKRDGDDVEVGNDCYPTSGSWTSAYDDETFSEPGDLDIDHVVPLSEAWKSGASSWTQEEREGFANNLEISQLIAVSAASNRSKSDKDPAKWMPPSEGYHCTYARMWVWVKHTYEMTVDTDEKAAITEALEGC